jgi:hypothetical protein
MCQPLSLQLLQMLLQVPTGRKPSLALAAVYTLLHPCQFSLLSYPKLCCHLLAAAAHGHHRRHLLAAVGLKGSKSSKRRMRRAARDE